MKAVCGTGRQEYGAKNVTLYAFISVGSLFKHIPRIGIYMTGSGRVVTNRNIPASLVVMVRMNDAAGTEIKDAMEVPDPPAPAGAPRVRSRDSHGSSPAPMGSNYHGLPLPDGKTVTKAGKELRTGHMHMLSHLVQGSPWNQHRELQMARGAFKSVQCRHEGTREGCLKGASCVFRHWHDDDMALTVEVRGVRRRIYTELHENGFFSHPRFYMIGQISTAQLNAALDARARHQERLDEQALHEQAMRAQRPRMHDNSCSPRSTPHESVTPEPPRRGAETHDVLVRMNKGKSKGSGPAIKDVDTDARLRDHTAGGDDEEASDREEEAVAPIDNNDMNIRPLRSLSPSDREVVTEPTQQLADESGDAIMGDGIPTVEA